MKAGRDVRVSVDARIFGGERLQIGDNVRVDAFCLLSTGATGFIHFSSHIHIASGVRLFGEGGITIENFSSISAGSTVYSASDDYDGSVLIGPTIPERWTSIDKRPVSLAAYSSIGAHALILPGVSFGEGAVLGAMGMANRDLEPWTIYVGAPCRAIRPRQRGMIDLASEFLATWPDQPESGE